MLFAEFFYRPNSYLNPNAIIAKQFNNNEHSSGFSKLEATMEGEKL